MLVLVGYNGLTGQEFIRILAHRGNTVSVVLCGRSKPSASFIDMLHDLPTKMSYRYLPLEELCVDWCIQNGVQAVVFATHDIVSMVSIPQLVAGGIICIDKSSYWRLDPKCWLRVPGIAEPVGTETNKLWQSIPNCATTPVAVWGALCAAIVGKPVAKVFITTLQSVSGSGYKGLEQLALENSDIQADTNNSANLRNHVSCYTKPIANNVIPAIDTRCNEVGDTFEEYKVAQELQKLWGYAVEAFVHCVRVPVTFGHSHTVDLQWDGPIGLSGAELEEKIMKHIKSSSCSLEHYSNTTSIHTNVGNPTPPWGAYLGYMPYHADYANSAASIKPISMVTPHDMANPAFLASNGFTNGDKVFASRLRVKGNTISIFLTSNNTRLGAALLADYLWQTSCVV
jgi:aspartate-semialdehyde dehydrogenase